MPIKESYFSFWKKSSNQHGVHSPFVFSLLTKGLYLKDNRWSQMKKKDAFLERIYEYFSPSSFVVINGDLKNDNLFSRGLVSGEVISSLDMIYVGQAGKDVITTSDLYSYMHNDSVLMIDRRFKNAVSEQLWQEIVCDDRFIVTLDFYYYGVAFIRTEQLKQHFVLRM
ncbi:hypothetical protein [Myroides pelagicus]|uniref:Uncharacterized protein n=1 Tax=Myroides pelagicus TaxID=270914 RepID=A0A7K1GKH4_9FLAO|nr:hypothetical protein [Myroides pelagicus]MEC4114266.1 hypothetical protein [Myroides pelagicus]MTH29316.1 hypothetical protein [Myroides pelagicus]